MTSKEYTMTETVSKVYDLTYPSPATLKEISSIVVAVDLWREEICAWLKTPENSDELNLTKKIRLENVIPNLPSAIYSFLDEYIATFRNSIMHWLYYHKEEVLSRLCLDDASNSILSRFHDFAWDWDGTIHYPRTAKRMILCDRLTEYEKFTIACFYCFEDDIKRIWPTVSAKMGIYLHNNTFHYLPQLYYWLCYLKNELHKVPTSTNESMDQNEMMFYKCKSNNLSCMKYFWNRLRPDRQSRIDIDKLRTTRCQALFIRFMLPTLNEHQLEIFVTTNGCNLVRYLLKSESAIPRVLPTWMYIRDKIYESSELNFIRCVQEMLATEISLNERSRSRSVVYLFGEIWKSAPQHLKQSALHNVLHNKMLLDIRNTSTCDCRAMKFLITVLQDATFEERNAFCLEHWRILICGAPIEDLIELMKLSFRNENEITLFKENTIARYENIAEWCVRLLTHGSFEALHDFLSFCCTDAGERRELKRRLLWSNLRMVRNIKSLNEFIDDAFQDAADLGVKFRHQFASSPATLKYLFERIRSGDFIHLMELVDTFFSEEQAVVSVKKRLFECFNELLMNGSVQLGGSDDVQGFLIWLLGSEDEVIRFKLAIPVEDIFRAMMQTSTGKAIIREYCDGVVQIVRCDGLDGFLMWYFNKDKEEIKKFEEQLPVELKMLVSRKRRRIV